MARFRSFDIENYLQRAIASPGGVCGAANTILASGLRASGRDLGIHPPYEPSLGDMLEQNRALEAVFFPLMLSSFHASGRDLGYISILFAVLRRYAGAESCPRGCGRCFVLVLAVVDVLGSAAVV